MGDRREGIHHNDRLKIMVFFLGNFHFRGNRFLENLGESGLGKFFSSENLEETLQGKFTKNGKFRGNQLGEFF